VSRKPRTAKHSHVRQVTPADADREWFKQNPDADQYVREITRAEKNMLRLAGELPQTHVLVTQLAPGVRKRQFVTVTFLSAN
jgi:hypothetical protein